MATRGRICLIDDDGFVRDALALGLTDAGYDVITAPGAAAGFDVANREYVHAIVTDMNMPGTDGAQLISQARAAWPKIPIVAISGSSVVGERSLMDVARDRGADAALAKPFTIRELTALLNPLLAKSKS